MESVRIDLLSTLLQKLLWIIFTYGAHPIALLMKTSEAKYCVMHARNNLIEEVVCYIQEQKLITILMICGT
jgi:hypothetical protein